MTINEELPETFFSWFKNPFYDQNKQLLLAGFRKRQKNWEVQFWLLESLECNDKLYVHALEVVRLSYKPDDRFDDHTCLTNVLV